MKQSLAAVRVLFDWLVIGRVVPHNPAAIRGGCGGSRLTLENGGLLEHAQKMAAHASARTTKLYDRRGEAISLDEVERISL